MSALVGVMLAACSILGATALGGILGQLLNGIEKKTYVTATAAAAGVMLCASVHGLVLSAMEQWSPFAVCLGVLMGAALLQRLNGGAEKLCGEDVHRVQQLHGFLFVFAIAAHHLPEGLAAGVSFGLGDGGETVSVCGAIALQNIPETMMILPAMAGFSRGKRVAAVIISGGVEMIGLLMGYCAVQVSVQLLPVMLSLAAGAMLFVVFESMLPDAYGQEHGSVAGAVLGGYCGMLAVSEWLGEIL